MFEKIVLEHPSLPERVESSTSINRTFVDSIEITEVYACLPGGRGCIGKERMGRKLLDRQVARFNARGLKTNPRHNSNNPEKYGFLQLIGHIHYKDGKTNKINIPVEPSGVVGLRTGASSLALIDPGRNNNSAGNNLMRMVKEIQSILFNMLGIREVAQPKFGMINGMFNIYTDKKGKERPRMTRFVQVVRDIRKTTPMLQHYQKPSMPWLRVQQGVPAVMKAIYKPLPEEQKHKNYRRDIDALPTLTLSPYGHVEIMGAKSIASIIRAYNMFNQSARQVDVTVNQLPNKNIQPIKKTRQRRAIHFPNSSMIVMKRGRQLFINNKLCETLPKPVVTRIASDYGIPSRGTKATVCERLFSIL